MQQIVNVRIDERLIHGQVASFWSNYLKASRIMVIDAQAAKDSIQKMALKMACPAGIKLSVLPPESAARNLLANKYEGERIFVVLKGPEVILELLDLGVAIPEVNVGNMSSAIGTKAVKRSVNVTQEDIENFKILDEKGVKLVAQMVPSDEEVSFMKLLKD
ncbi:MAG: PTS system mannose/fructose/N-acetylgalactosamine-transporter subunit IIB [Bacilli bacterium]